MRLLALTCGRQTGRFRGREAGPLTIPTPVFLVEHEQGLVLVDTGLHPAMGHDPASRIGGLAKAFAFQLSPEEHVDARLRAIGVDPAGLRCLVLTHLHYDHAGGCALIPPHVELYVQAGEWAAAHDPDAIATNAYVPGDLTRDRPLVALRGEHDLFGDGQIILVRTPGHSAGHQSVLLRPPGGQPVLLCGDACYFADWLDTGRFPPWTHDREQERRSLAVLRAQRDRGARLVFGHDPVAWAQIPQAPAAVF